MSRFRRRVPIYVITSLTAQARGGQLSFVDDDYGARRPADRGAALNGAEGCRVAFYCVDLAAARPA